VGTVASIGSNMPGMASKFCPTPETSELKLQDPRRLTILFAPSNITETPASLRLVPLA